MLISTALQIKLGDAILITVLSLPAHLWLSWTTRSLRWLGVLLGTSLATFLGLWAIQYGSGIGLLGYLRGCFELARTYGSAMNLLYDPIWGWVALAGVSYCGATWWARRLPAGPALALFAPAMALWFRYAHTRADIHVVDFLYVLLGCLLFYAILFQSSPGARRAGLALCCALGLSWLALGDHPNELVRGWTPWAQLRQSSVSRGPRNSLQLLTGTPRHLQPDASPFEELRLPEVLLLELKQATVDVFPWKAAVVHANDLNWRPRGIVQSYSAHSLWLDEFDASAFRAAAPQWVLFHDGFSTLDRRYFLSDEPRTTEELVRWYHPHTRAAGHEGRIWTLWRRTPIAALGPPQPLGTQEVALGERIAVPVVSSKGALRARMQLENSLAGSFVKTLYKDTIWRISYFRRDKSPRQVSPDSHGGGRGCLDFPHRAVIRRRLGGVGRAPFPGQCTGEGNRSACRQLEDRRRLLASDGATSGGYHAHAPTPSR